MGNETARFFFVPGGSGNDELFTRIEESEQRVNDTLEGHVKQLRALREKLKSRKLKRRRKKASPAEELPPLDLLLDHPTGNPSAE